MFRKVLAAMFLLTLFVQVATACHGLHLPRPLKRVRANRQPHLYVQFPSTKVQAEYTIYQEVRAFCGIRGCK